MQKTDWKLNVLMVILALISIPALLLKPSSLIGPLAVLAMACISRIKNKGEQLPPLINSEKLKVRRKLFLTIIISGGIGILLSFFALRFQFPNFSLELRLVVSCVTFLILCGAVWIGIERSQRFK